MIKYRRRFIKSKMSFYEVLKASTVMEKYGIDGVPIQQRSRQSKHQQWFDVNEPLWNWHAVEYRIKPKD